MANIMSLKSIRNHAHRDGFDLSRKNAFTAKLGELLPVMVEDCMPGDKFKIRTDWFTRTQPVTSPAFTRFGEYYDFYFVPYHLLWRHFPNFIVQTDAADWANSLTTYSSEFRQHPYLSSVEVLAAINKTVSTRLDQNNKVQLDTYMPNYNRFAYSYGALKLLEYLGYGTGHYLSLIPTGHDYGHVVFPSNSSVSNANKHNVALNPFPLAAYQKIYNDHYRNSQWESPSPYSYNFDYINNPSGSMKVPVITDKNAAGFETQFKSGLFALRYANFNKDYFLGRLPEKQYGNEALATPLRSANGIFREANMLDSNNNIIGNMLYRNTGSTSSGTNSLFRMNYDDSWASVGIGALALRQAEFLQKWKEITQSGDTDYVSQIQKHFGIKPNSEMAHRSRYLGGITHKFGVSEVVNTNLSSSSSEASLFGKGENGGSGSIDFECKEHGILMCIYHVGLLPEYSSNFTNKLMYKTTPDSYVITEMDNVGMQSVIGEEFIGALVPGTESSLETFNKIIGYVPRYAEYKTNVDKVCGAFANTLFNWVTPLNKISAKDIKDGNVPSLNSSMFYKIDPHILNSVFSVYVDSTSDTDQFLVNCNFDIKAVRNISRDGLPY